MLGFGAYGRDDQIVVLSAPKPNLRTHWWQPLPSKDYTYEGVRIKFVGWFGDQYILRWGD